MTKRKTDADPAAQVGSEKPGKQNAAYRVGKWRGHTNYSCATCHFATLRKREIEAHVKVHRTPTRKRAR